MQIINCKWKSNENWKPFLLLSDGSSIDLFEDELKFGLGKKKCIGFSVNGKRRPCPKDKELESGNMCYSCQRADDFFACVKCRGECINQKQRMPCARSRYFVYLALFDSLLKVGITQENRFMERLIEQGADFAALVVNTADGMIVRQVEQQLRVFLGCQDRISGELKQKLIFGDPNSSVLKLTKALAIIKKGNFNLINPQIYDLRRHYRLDKITAQPKVLKIQENSNLNCRVVAAKGNILIIKNGVGLWSLDTKQLIGREIISENLEAGQLIQIGI